MARTRRKKVPVPTELPGITPQEFEIIKRAIGATWQAIGGDAEALEGWSGKLDEMAELVLDADRILMYGGNEYRNIRDLHRRVYAVPYPQLEALAMAVLS